MEHYRGLKSVKRRALACCYPTGGTTAHVLAIDYARLGIRVNCICPGFIDTPLTRSVLDMEAMSVFKERYRETPDDSLITLVARGGQTDAPIGCSVDLGRALYDAEAHEWFFIPTPVRRRLLGV